MKAHSIVKLRIKILEHSAHHLRRMHGVAVLSRGTFYFARSVDGSTDPNDSTGFADDFPRRCSKIFINNPVCCGTGGGKGRADNDRRDRRNWNA